MKGLVFAGAVTLFWGCASIREGGAPSEVGCAPAVPEESVYEDFRTRSAIPRDSSKVVLHGYVRGRDTRYPLKGVLVAAASERATRTNEAGVYRLEVTPTLSGTLLFQMPGYASVHFDLASVVPVGRLDVELQQCVSVINQ